MSDSTRFKFCRMRKADVEPIAKLDADVFGIETWPLQAFYEAFGERSNSWFVLKQGGAIVAYCLVEKSGSNMSILSICTSESMRGKGLGSILLSRAIQHAFINKCRALKLEVHEKNFGAQRIYERFGFRPLSLTEEPYYHDGGKALKMELCLKDVDAKRFTKYRLRKMMLALNDAGTVK